jgi:O-antigen/teichoic acid export membrane protein
LSKLKELFSDTVVYGISSVLARFINYLLVPLYTFEFATDQYGIVGLVYAGIAILNVIFTMGMESSYLRYAKNRTEAAHWFKTLQVFLLGASLLIVLILWLTSPLVKPLISLQDNASIYWMMLGILFFDTLSIVPFAELRLVRRAKLFAVLRVLNVLINISLNIYLIFVEGYGIEAVFISNLAASAITAVLASASTLKLYTGSLQKEKLKTALIFGLPFVPAGIAHVINETLDRFFLKEMDPASVSILYGSSYTPDDIVGIYNACYKLAVFMLLFIQMFRMAWQPFFMRHSDDEEAPLTFATVFNYFNLFAGVVFLGVSLFVNDIVQLSVPVFGADINLIDKKYWLGLNIVPILLMAYWFQGMYMNFSAGIFIKNQTKRLPQVTLTGAFVTIIGNLVLVPRLGMEGSAWATLVSYGIMALMLYRYSTKSFSVPYSKIRTFLILLIAASVIIIKPNVVTLFDAKWVANLILFFSGAVLMTIIALPSISMKAGR